MAAGPRRPLLRDARDSHLLEVRLALLSHPSLSGTVSPSALAFRVGAAGLSLFSPPFSSRVSSHQTSNTIPVLKILFYPSEGLSDPMDTYEHLPSNAATCFNPCSPGIVINAKKSAKINICAECLHGDVSSALRRQDETPRLRKASLKQL